MDRRTRKTKEAIRSAYFELQKKNAHERVKVTDIARLADIDRKTFYLHYNTVEDIVQEFFDEKIEEMLKKLSETDFYNVPLRVDILFDVIHNIIMSDMPIYRELASNDGYINFWVKISDIMVEALVKAYKSQVNISEAKLRLYAVFFSSGLVTVYQEWLRGESELSLEMIGESMIHLYKNGIIDIFL